MSRSRVSSTHLFREDARVGAGAENYVKFRKSFNLWVKNGPAEGEKEPRGTAIGQYGRLQPDIWGAMFELYEYNLRDELGEDSGGVATLRQGLTWVDGDKKTAGFGEKHPTTESTVDGMRSQADRRVEVLMFNEGEEPNLGTTNGEDIYDGVTFERRRVEAMESAIRAAVVSLDVGAATPWSDSARVTLIAADGTVISDQTVTAGEISGARRIYRFRGPISNMTCRIAVLEKNSAYYLSDWLILSGASLVPAPPRCGRTATRWIGRLGTFIGDGMNEWDAPRTQTNGYRENVRVSRLASRIGHW